MLANGDENYDDTGAGWPMTLFTLAAYFAVVMAIFGLSLIVPQWIMDGLGGAFALAVLWLVARSS